MEICARSAMHCIHTNAKRHTIRFVFCRIVTRIGSDVVTTLSIRPLREIVRHANSTFYDSAERARERGNFTVAICQVTYLHGLLRVVASNASRSLPRLLTGSRTLLALAQQVAFCARPTSHASSDSECLQTTIAHSFVTHRVEFMASRNLSNSLSLSLSSPLLLFSSQPQSITIMQFFCRRTNVTEFACGLPPSDHSRDLRRRTWHFGEPTAHDEQKVTAKGASWVAFE